MTSALLRAGVLLDDRTLIYGVGGWTSAQFEAHNVTDNPFYQPVENFWVNGWTARGGVERKLDSNWSVRQNIDTPISERPGQATISHLQVPHLRSRKQATAKPI
jgi:long-subunit fatty acid transport protein